jgi:hypothetical protein
MSEEKNQYQQTFDAARDRFRITGAGGVTLPGGNSSAPPPPKQNPEKHVQYKNGVVTIGGKNVQTNKKTDNSSIRIFDYGKPKEDKKN